MNKLPKEKRLQALAALVEGNSIRSTARMVGVSKDTIVKLLADAGRGRVKFSVSGVIGPVFLFS